MKRNLFPILFLLFLLSALPGCTITAGSVVSTPEPSTTGEAVESVDIVVPTPAPVTEPISEPAPSGLRPIPVDHVQILTGWASPIPALVAVSGTWPDLCAQLAEISQPVIADFQIDITLLATAADPACPPDYLGLPFSIQIPLNWGQLPEGEYTVSVNGQETTLFIPVIPPELAPGDEPTLTNPVTPTPGAEPQTTSAVFPAVADPQPAPVAVTVRAPYIEVGVGSPLPVHGLISADWPSLCGQLATISQQVEPFRFEITVTAHPGRPDCPPDYVGYGFTLALPLNVVELPEGTYTVSVNGTETTFTVPVTPPAAGQAEGEG